ncbi:MAG: hypothetical protein HY815_15835 [Candidatus Riflebacteria bacterium]|nr:hypothetical protein [Candidatus Riflebacteria bacterium]
MEALIAVVLAAVVFGSTLYFMRTSTQGVVKADDHALARLEAMRVLDQIGWDLDRLVVGDEIDDPEASVLKPFKNWKDNVDQGASFGFYAFHHRVFYRTPPKPYIVLTARWIDYRVEKIQGKQGVNLVRNTKVVNKFPLHDVKLEKVKSEYAQQLGVSEEHCVRIKVLPMGQWDTRNEDIWKRNAQERIFHLKGVESRYAALMSLKRVLQSTGQAPPPGYEKLSLLPNPPALDPNDPTAGTVILNWMQPQNLIYFEKNKLFDDQPPKVDEPVNIPAF